MENEDVAEKVYSLLLQVPWQRWTPIGVTNDELGFLHDTEWLRVSGLPREWDAWEDAIRVVDREGKWRLYDKKYGKGKVQKTASEPFTDAGVKFVDRDELQTCDDEETVISDQLTLSDLLETGVHTYEPVDWRGEHFLWSAGGNCCA